MPADADERESAHLALCLLEQGIRDHAMHGLQPRVTVWISASAWPLANTVADHPPACRTQCQQKPSSPAGGALPGRAVVRTRASMKVS